MVMVDFLNENPSFVFNKLCVDIGCGTGVRSRAELICSHEDFRLLEFVQEF
jgi:hypothetical protein